MCSAENLKNLIGSQYEIIRPRRSFHRSWSGPSWNIQRRSFLEHEPDVTFHVGQKPEIWRIPAHKDILSRSNPVFHAMFRGPCSSSQQLEHPDIDETIAVTDVDARGFQNLMSFLYGERVELRSVGTAFTTLHAAHKYMNPDLIDICIHYIDGQINPNNVLYILQNALIYAAHSSRYQEEHPSQRLQVPDLSWCGPLIQKCLEIIDKFASTVLASEDLEDLNREALRLILQRDTLQIIYESEILDALSRWAQCECRRQQMDLSPQNRRKVLGDLLWQVRFLAMSMEEFLVGPITSGLLDVEEQLILIGCLHGRQTYQDLPNHLRSHLPRLCTKRLSLNCVPTKEDIQFKAIRQKPIKFALRRKTLPRRAKLYGAQIAEKILFCLSCIFE